MHEKFYPDVPPHGMHQMVATLAITIAVTGNSNHQHFVIRKLCPCCNGQAAAMKTIKGVALQIVGKFPGLANTRDNEELVWFYAHFNESLLKGFQDSKVATSGAPCRSLSFVIIQGRH